MFFVFFKKKKERREPNKFFMCYLFSLFFKTKTVFKMGNKTSPKIFLSYIVDISGDLKSKYILVMKNFSNCQRICLGSYKRDKNSPLN